MEKYELGFQKKSFSLFFGGGEIWCEHLDALYEKTELLKQKFTEDLLEIARPSISGFIAVNLDETEVSEETLEFIVEGFKAIGKPIRKIAFIGLDAERKKQIKRLCGHLPFAVLCTYDFEKAKEWLIKEK